MTSLTQLKIVIASPNDVREEREALDREIQKVNRFIAERLGLTLKALRWETDTYPGFHIHGPQGLVDSILNIQYCDIFIGILWKRFGTPIKENGETGTEHEFYEAYEAWKENQRPHIMLYFNQKEYSHKTPAELEQHKAVLNFKENLPKEGLYWEYNGLEEFKDLVFGHLSLYLQDDKLLFKETGKKRSVAKNSKRRIIYNDLNKNIFSPLLDYELETPYDYPISRLKLYYDLSSLKENPDYEEAKLHWEQDLKDIGIDPEVIEAQVKVLNKDVDMFFTSQIREPVIAAITTGGIFTAFESGTDIPALNQISIPNVIKELQSDWIEDTGVDQRYENDTHYYVLGNAIIATIEPQDETRLDHIINSLRSKDSPISLAIQALKQRRATILDDVKALNKEMKKRIINPINKNLYKTTCSQCDDYVISSMN